VKLFQVGKIAQDRDQLWAEAFKRYKDGESIRLKTSLWAEAGKLQESRRTIDPWEDKIDALVAGLPSDSDKQRVDPEEVWSSLGISLDRRSTQDGERIAALLERHGFRRMSVRGKDGKVMKGWGRDLVDGIWKPGGWE
jgi:predicted P-loop ATPase